MAQLHELSSHAPRTGPNMLRPRNPAKNKTFLTAAQDEKEP